MDLVEHFKQVVTTVEVTQLGFFLASFIIQNPTLVDIAWGVMHWLCGTLVLLNNQNTELLFTPKFVIAYTLLVVWLVRLSGFLFYYRIWKRHVDPRYTMMAAERNINETAFSLFQFLLQGLLAMGSAIPLYYVFSQNYHGGELRLNHYVSAVMCVVGIICESSADNQIQAHKDDKSPNKARIFRSGWYTKCRHPNLFFDLTFWYGMALYAFNPNNMYSLMAFIGPMFLTWIMVRLTIPITTKHMKQSRENYDEEIKRTNLLWPF
jgi:steroid 5-alpha reductase family enzyme